VLLAAGASRRFGDDKLRALVAGRPLVAWAVDAALDSGLRPVVVVTQPGREFEALPPETHLVANPDWLAGLSSSVRCGLEAAARLGCEAAIFAPADQPLLCGEVYRRLAFRFHETGAALVVAAYGSQPRNPVLLARPLWPAASRLEGDIGLAALARTGEAAIVECGDIASLADIDTPADLRALAPRLLDLLASIQP
jgi:CTP:molybdopterin cytidylyltransferase MocA